MAEAAKIVLEEGTVPTTPAANHWAVYPKTDGLYVVDDAGAETGPLGTGGGGGVPAAHAASHTDGTDDIQSATSAQKGLATAAQITKLDGIEAAADVTDATNVAAAGAVMDSDISAGEGFVRKTGAGTYEAIKSNLAASAAPGVSDDGTAGYAVGSRWIDTTGDAEYVCLDASTGAAVWTETTGAGSTPTLQQVTDAGAATTATVKVGSIQSNGGSSLIKNSTGQSIINFNTSQPAFYRPGQDMIVLSVGNEIRTGSTMYFAFGSGAPVATAADTWIGREAAGQVNIGATKGGKDGTIHTGSLVLSGLSVLTGSGTPEGVVIAPVGSLFLRSDGGAGTSMYVKESGAGNTGWVGK